MRNKRFKWTEEEERMIEELYPIVGPKVLAERMGKSIFQMKGKAKCMGIKFKVDPWTDEMIKIVRDRYEIDGPTKLSERLGLSPIAITAKARRLGVEPKNGRITFSWTDQMTLAMLERYETEGGDVLAKEFGASLGTVQHMAGKLGVRTNVGHVRWGKVRAENNESCDIHYFDEWSPNMAYILGFIFADGNIDSKRKSLRVCLADKDISVLEFIKKELKFKHEIYRRKGLFDPRTGNTNQPQVMLCIGSIVIANRLMELGVNPRKTYNDDPFPNVPDEMFPHFVRGYLDGDGSICVTATDTCFINFVGSSKFIVGLYNNFVRLVGVRPMGISNKKGNTKQSEIAWSSPNDLLLFRDFIYPKDGFDFCLERKRQKLFDWLSYSRMGIDRFGKRYYYHPDNQIV